jgi:indolepyruvate ferredoxin oxidoreductase alpha subunit
MKRSIIGNQAVAYGALAAGIDVAAGYPGTPSSEALNELLHFSLTASQGGKPTPYVEWSVNEKVAFELATGAAWAGKRALATMKMSGANVAADSILSVAYSGTKGGLVLYIADDPGAEAGMPEQDTRLFAQWAGLPVLEPADPSRAYELTRYAFELSERCELPVILRSVTSVAHANQEVEGEYAYKALKRKADFEKNIFRYTKAGAVICMDQHRDLLERLKAAERNAAEAGINRLQEADSAALFVVAAGALIPYVREALSAGNHRGLSTLFLESVYPLDTQLAGRMFEKAERVLVLEELEPFVEMQLRSEASRLGWNGTFLGKLDQLFPRVGKYSQEAIGRGLKLLAEGWKTDPPARTSAATTGRFGGGGAASQTGTASQTAAEPVETARPAAQPETTLNVKHPITFCAGCPHRGSFMAINRALKKIGLNRDNTVVTGDIGCTILGMNPPFHTCWTEVSMGSSIGLAQGFYWGGIENPLIATIGDSTFFHAGIPPLVNAIQHGTNLLVIILDNGWTSMTGFQINPGTAQQFQAKGARRVEIQGILRGMGVENLQVIGPFDQEQSVEAIVKALKQEGVKVIISQQECALTAARREERTLIYRIDSEKCTFCRSCLRETGCPALYVTANGGKSKHGQVMAIDPELCTGCGLCYTCCKFDAIGQQKLGGSSS